MRDEVKARTLFLYFIPHRCRPHPFNKWRRRESNSDPKADPAGIYMLSRFSFLISPER